MSLPKVTLRVICPPRVPLLTRPEVTLKPLPSTDFADDTTFEPATSSDLPSEISVETTYTSDAITPPPRTPRIPMIMILRPTHHLPTNNHFTDDKQGY